MNQATSKPRAVCRQNIFMKSIAYLFENGIVRNMYTYPEYMLLMEQVVAEGKTTGPQQSEELSYYTKLNLHRMQRLNKTVELTPALREAIGKIKVRQTWFILTEAWCGDAAQIIPVLATAAKANSLIEMKFLLRDENHDLMNLYLTNGGRSIPKLISVDSQYHELFNYGPRPAGALKLLAEYKANPEKTYKAFSEDIQRWYLADKTQSIQNELTALLEGF